MMVGIRQLCALSVFCALALSLMPEGNVKQVSAIGCSLLLILSLANAIGRMDLSAYSLELARYREKEQEILQRADETRDLLDRRVMEQECEAYIWDKASQLGIRLTEVSVTARWSMEGFWQPYSAALRADCGEGQRQRLAERIEAELGIALERQEWSAYGEEAS